MTERVGVLAGVAAGVAGPFHAHTRMHSPTHPRSAPTRTSCQASGAFALAVTAGDVRAAREALGKHASLDLHRSRPDEWRMELRSRAGDGSSDDFSDSETQEGEALETVDGTRLRDADVSSGAWDTRPVTVAGARQRPAAADWHGGSSSGGNSPLASGVRTPVWRLPGLSLALGTNYGEVVFSPAFMSLPHLNAFLDAAKRMYRKVGGQWPDLACGLQSAVLCVCVFRVCVCVCVATCGRLRAACSGAVF